MEQRNKIAFFELEDWEKDYFKEKLGAEYDLIFIDSHISEENVTKASNCTAIGIFIYSQITREILEKLPKLKFITTLSTGYDHIDIKACKEKRIVVSNVPAYGENTVAEHTFALILAIARKLIPSIERTRRGNFDLTNLRGFDLKGKILGVIGTGKIGTHVIKIARGFDMEVIAYDPKPNYELAHVLGFEYVDSLETLLRRADIITLHALLNEQTYHLINKNNIKNIKKGAILINTARGALIETEALLSALKEGIIAYAGLDVLEEECFIKEEKQLLSEAFKRICDLKTVLAEHMLLGLDNVLITPHNAFNSTEALKRILDTTIENIKSFFMGKPINVVSEG